MHELSIATSIVEIAGDAVRAAGGGRVVAVTLRLGRLASVHEGSLRSAFEIAAEGTPLEAAGLHVVTVPVTIFCGACGMDVELAGIGSLACPRCGRVSGEIRAGTELEVESIEVEPPEIAVALPVEQVSA